MVVSGAPWLVARQAASTGSCSGRTVSTRTSAWPRVAAASCARQSSTVRSAQCTSSTTISNARAALRRVASVTISRCAPRCLLAGSIAASAAAWSGDWGSSSMSRTNIRSGSASCQAASMPSMAAALLPCASAPRAAPVRLCASMRMGSPPLPAPKSSTRTRCASSPRSRASATKRPASRLLPMPASPRISTTRPWPERRQLSATPANWASSASLPTKACSAGACSTPRKRRTRHSGIGSATPGSTARATQSASRRPGSAW
ncbi:hypothetical protein D9M72_482340 [compost metagenome]